MTSEQKAAFDRLSATTQAFLGKVARRIAEKYEGEIVLHVKRGGISYIRWVQVDDGDTIKDDLKE